MNSVNRSTRLSARRRQLQYRSVFDRYELESSFVKKELMNHSHVANLMRTVALSCEPASQLQDQDGDICDWKSVVTDLSKEACAKLHEMKFLLQTVKLVSTHTSSNNLTKLILELQDGKQIETCIIRFGGVLGRKRVKENVREQRPRVTVCVSSQIGCRMECDFCETGTMGLLGNLTCGEIIEQAVIANAVEKRMRIEANGGTLPPEDAQLHGVYIRNITFMGMGEPMDNYSEVIMAVRMLTSQRLFALSPSRVTVSTVGCYPDKIRRLIDDAPKVSLALSLHAPNQELRESIVRSAKGVSLADLLDACYAFVDNQRKISKSTAKKQVLLIEYTLLRNINDSDEAAREIGRLLRPQDTIVNFIPYNPTNVQEEYQAPLSERVTAMASIVQEAGIRCYVRQEFGQEVGGACGQLVAKDVKKTPPRLQSSMLMSEAHEASIDTEQRLFAKEEEDDGDQASDDDDDDDDNDDDQGLVITPFVSPQPVMPALSGIPVTTDNVSRPRVSSTDAEGTSTPPITATGPKEPGPFVSNTVDVFAESAYLPPADSRVPIPAADEDSSAAASKAEDAAEVFGSRPTTEGGTSGTASAVPARTNAKKATVLVASDTAKVPTAFALSPSARVGAPARSEPPRDGCGVDEISLDDNQKKSEKPEGAAGNKPKADSFVGWLKDSFRVHPTEWIVGSCTLVAAAVLAVNLSQQLRKRQR